jgi:hypothetical protein
MSTRINRYLLRFQSQLPVATNIKESAALELNAHLQDKIQELKNSNLNEDEAEEVALQELGSPELIAREIYKAHAQGNWRESFLAALPHLSIALLIATSHYFKAFSCLLIALTVITSVTVLNWHRFRSLWLMPWLGYYLFPVIIGGVLLIYLSQGWMWIVTTIYVATAISTTTYIVKQVVQQDRLYALLMLAPTPVVLSWMLSLSKGEVFTTGSINLEQMSHRDPWVILSFLSLAIATTIMVRLQQRQCKIAVLLIPAIIIPLLVTLGGEKNLSSENWILLSLSLCAFISPFFMRTKNIPLMPEKCKG